MAIYRKNLELLQKHHPDVFNLVSKLPPSGSVSCSVTGGFVNICCNGIWRYDATINWQETASVIDVPYPKLVIVYGFGGGNHLRMLLERPASKETEHILVFERDATVFNECMKNGDYSELLSDPRVTFIVGVPESEVIGYLKQYFLNYSRLFLTKTIIVCIEPAIDDELQKYYLHCADTVRKVVYDANCIFMGCEEDSYRGFLNIIKNIPNFERAYRFDDFANKFKGKIGVAVSTGPSLKHSFGWLREVQDKVVIAASDSALKILLDNGITPHFVGCLERVPETNLLFDELPDNLNTGLICSSVVWPETIQKFKGPVINMLRSIGQMCWFFDDQKNYFTGSSVSHLLYVSLAEMGCSQILIVGQDLAYDRFSTSTHVGGVHPLLHQVGQKQRYGSSEASSNAGNHFELPTQVMGNNGHNIETMEWYVQFKYQLEGLIKKYNGIGINVIPKDYGARILGIERIDPADVLGRFNFEQESIADQLNVIYHDFDVNRDINNYRRQMSLKFQEARRNLSRVNEMALNVLDALTLFRQRFSPNYYPESHFLELFKKVEFIANQMISEDDKFYDYFFYAQMMSKNALLKQFQSQILADRIPEGQRVEMRYLLSMEWYEAMQRWSARMLNYLNNNTDHLFATSNKEHTNAAGQAL